jgi:hypothetical protein
MRHCILKSFVVAVVVSLVMALLFALLVPPLFLFFHYWIPVAFFVYLTAREADKLGYSCEEADKLLGDIALLTMDEAGIAAYFVILNLPNFVIKFAASDLDPLFGFFSSVAMAYLLYLAVARHMRRQQLH